MKHIAYEVDQLLDEIATDAPLKKLKVESQPSTSKVLGFFSSFTNPFESRIKDLLVKLDFLAKQKDMLGLKQDTCASNEGGVSWKPSQRFPSTSLVDESGIYGRDDDKEVIIKSLLLDIDCGNQVPIVSIVGLGGMGKTTLAQLVYNDNKIKENFEHRAWVYVSETFDVIGLTKAILRSFHSSADGEVLNLLQNQLQQELIGKKYLLVLDDVWNRSEECWERLLLPLYHGSIGSKIIVTTRDKEVASAMKSIKVLNLKKLKKSECWSMFVRHAFHGRNASEYPNIESIGKKIVKKCGGLPLAIKILGNLLRRKFSPREWANILEKDVWHLSEGDGNINSVLRLSYHHLPSNLKRCFAYCSILPKGRRFDKDETIKIWMADGLLKCCRTNKSEKELGNEIFDDLVSISFFKLSTSFKSKFTMHDLIHDLAKSIAGEFYLRLEGDMLQDVSERTRHIWCSLDSKDGDKITQHIYKIKGLRSLMAETGFGDQRFEISKTIQHELFSRQKYLRMLSFYFCTLKKLDDGICNLKLLRYLNLSLTDITSLPDSICMLYNLQTLILQFCKLTELPSDFYKLANLCHLYLKQTNIKKMPKQIGRLNNLQTLTHFVVGEKSGSDIKELAELNQLQGKLCISGLDNFINPADVVEANLKDKKHLKKLHMIYGTAESIGCEGGSSTREIDASINERDVLEAFQPNSNLNRLTIEYYKGSSFPNWLGGYHLPNLVSLQLIHCNFCSQFPPLGQLPSLKKLYIHHSDGIEIIGKEFYGNNSTNVPFRSLKVLEFQDMPHWKEWLCVEGFPLLKNLSIKECPMLERDLPQHLPALQKLVISNCQKLEASIPKADNIQELELIECDGKFATELPSNSKKFILRGNEHSELSIANMMKRFLHGELEFDGSDFLECPSLDFSCYDSLPRLLVSGWHFSSVPFALHVFTNLHSLELFDFPQLESFPRGGLPSNLSKLVIHNCPKLICSREDWGLFQLSSLKYFRVSDEFENVESFPEENLLPHTLDTLFLYNCSKLRTMNYKGLLHLKSLYIWSCPCLESLPEEGLSNSLSCLEIGMCPLIKEKYQKEGGERWHTIRHIPTIKITE